MLPLMSHQLQRFAKPLSGAIPIAGSNPVPSAKRREFNSIEAVPHHKTSGTKGDRQAVCAGTKAGTVIKTSMLSGLPDPKTFRSVKNCPRDFAGVISESAQKPAQLITERQANAADQSTHHRHTRFNG